MPQQPSDRDYTLRLAQGSCSVERAPALDPDATVRSDSSTCTDVLLHGLPVDSALDDVRMTIEGDRSALEPVVAAFPLLTSP